jgi:hypothetical protein
MRIGQALGLRHEDFVAARASGGDRRSGGERQLGSEKKSRGSVPVTTELVRCYSDYTHEE